MLSTPAACLAVLALVAAPDPADLVAGLGSDRAEAREEAAEALKALGRDALLALREGRRAVDPIVRRSASALWDEIQRDLMVRPTLVRLDFEDTPASEVTRAIGARAGIRVNPAQVDRRIRLREPDPVPFWRSVDQACAAGRLQPYLNTSTMTGGHPRLDFHDQEPSARVSIDGPFLVELVSLHRHRDLTLIGGPWARDDRIGQRIAIPPSTPPCDLDARAYAELRIWVEPRTWLVQRGPAEVVEAVDDLGQSLRPPDGEAPPYQTFYTYGGTTQQPAKLPLAYPDRPGAKIARLRGTIPVTLEVRDPDPVLVVPLADAQGRTYRQGEVILDVQEVGLGGDRARVQIAARLDLEHAGLPGPPKPRDITARLGDLGQHQIEIADADGKVLTDRSTGSTSPENRASLNYSWSSKDGGPGARLRLFRLVRVDAEVPFAFADLPMP